MKGRVAIIGAGVLGLCLAKNLADEFEVTIIERESDAGGLASGLQIDGYSIEKYYHHWFKGDADIIDLIHELRLDDNLVWPAASSGIYTKNGVYDLSTPFDILKFPELSFVERLRLGVVSFVLQKFVPYSLVTSSKALDFVRRFFGNKISSLIWEPLLKGKFGKYYDQIGMTWLLARIKDRASSRPSPLGKEYLGYLDGGFAKLIDALTKHLNAQNVELLLETSITGYSHIEGAHNIEFINKNGPASKTFDAIISTVPGPVFPKIFGEDVAPNEVNYIGASCMLLRLKHSLSPYYWLSIADSDAPMLAVIEHTNLIDKAKYNGEILVYVAKYMDSDDPMFKLDEKSLLQKYLPFLQKINPQFSTNWIIATKAFKSAFAQHIVPANYKVPPYATKISGLFSANFSQIYPHDRGTNFAVKQAKEVSQLVRKYFDAKIT